MPHVVVKMFSGRTTEQKVALTKAIEEALMTTLGSKSTSISVGIEDYDPAEWDVKVKAPDIDGKADTLFKKPGY